MIVLGIKVAEPDFSLLLVDDVTQVRKELLLPGLCHGVERLGTIILNTGLISFSMSQTDSFLEILLLYDPWFDAKSSQESLHEASVIT